jgi:penicillin V acylase-like amidase (Ntn superfamily)
MTKETNMKVKIYILLLAMFSNITLACTVFDTKNDKNEILVGRNFDWSKDNGQINFISASKNSNGMLIISLNNPNMPYEGMNDKGLFIAISAVPNTETTVNILKPCTDPLKFAHLRY